jgi:catechol 2,3-dioxygenase-like lactoylglutathione lyase family enzyme
MIGRMQHVNIVTTRLAETLNFYGEVLGMKIGPLPARAMAEGAWIYDTGGTAVVHVVSIDPARPESMSDRVRSRLAGTNGVDPAILKSTGPVDHVAFECTDYDGLAARFRRLGVPMSENARPGAAFRQIFLTDPNGVTLELNFPG